MTTDAQIAANRVRQTLLERHNSPPAFLPKESQSNRAQT